MSGIGTLTLTYDLGRRLWNHRAGLYAAIALLFVFEFTYQMKRAQIDPLITHVMPLDQINHGFELMEKGESIRSVVVF